MSCSQCIGIEKVFDSKVAQRELKRYLKKGPSKMTAFIIDTLKDRGVQGKTLLDIGGGIGVIQHELLEAGAARVTNIDGATAYIEVAEEESRRRGFGDKVHNQKGDFVELAGEIADADIVTLDKVICCYPDMTALVGLSAAKARQYYAIVFPREHLLIRIFGRVGNVILRIMKNDFSFYLHGTEKIKGAIESTGLRPITENQDFIWQTIIYAR